MSSTAARLCQCQRHDYALAGSQAVSLDHDGRALSIDVGVRRSGIGERPMASSGNAVLDHEVLGEVFRAFELSAAAGRPEDFQARGAEGIHDPVGERRLGSHHRQGNRLLAGELCQLVDGGDRDVEQAILLGCSGIARRHVHAPDAPRLRQPPGYGVLLPPLPITSKFTQTSRPV
jgi:hypothetical protein